MRESHIHTSNYFARMTTATQMRMATHARCARSLLDAAVVGLSLFSIAATNESAGTVRILRAIRIVRLFGKVPSSTYLDIKYIYIYLYVDESTIQIYIDMYPIYHSTRIVCHFGNSQLILI